MTGPVVTCGETMACLSTAQAGPLRTGGTLRLGIAGSESNVAIGLARLGHVVAWIGRVGEDELGELVLRTLRAEGVDVSHARREAGAPTGLMIKERRVGAVTRVHYYRAGSAGSRLRAAGAELVEDPNGTVIELEDGYELLGMGYGNPTPWACPRDVPEDELAERIDKVAATVRDTDRAIFSLHVPPLGSGLDVAPKLDDYLRPRVGAAGLEMIPVGSTATRDAIAKYRPMIGLHGHIHESKGVKKLDGITIANPGSEYGEGVLDGLLVDIDPRKGVTNVELVTG
jgi:hypothetical protein